MSSALVPGGPASLNVRSARSCRRSASEASALRVVIDMERQFIVSNVRAPRMRQLGDVIPLPASVRPDPSADFRIAPDVAVGAGPEAAAIADELAVLLRQA